MKNREKRCWALDVEGTLLRLPVAIDEVREELRALSAARGIEKRFSPLLPAIAEVAAQIGPSFVDEAYALIARHELEAAAQASLCPGARELLEEVAAHEEPVLLVSNSEASALRAAFRSAGLEPRERALVGRRPQLAPKPDPAPLLEAIGSLAEPLKLLLCVGDRAPDMRMACAARPLLAARGITTRAIGVAEAEASREKLLAAGADQVVASLLELLAR